MPGASSSDPLLQNTLPPTAAKPRSAMTEVRPRRERGPRGLFPRRRRASPGVRRAALVVLLAASVGLLTATYRTGDAHFLPGQRQALQVMAPVERGMNRAWAPIAGGYEWTSRLVNATGENKKLRTEVSDLRLQLEVNANAEADNVKLRDLLAIKERGTFPAGYSQVAGQVIARSPSDADRSVVIDLGTSDGIQVDDPVMVPEGLIGRVEEVSSDSARVGLLTDDSAAVSATVVGRDASGVLSVSSTEGSPVLDLGYVAQHIDVEQGDIVVTSGWSTGSLQSIFPEGIPVGVVSSVGNSPADLYKTVQVTPFADFDRVDDVLVLVPKAGTPTSYQQPPAQPPATPVPAPYQPASAGTPHHRRAHGAAAGVKRLGAHH
jgi:rod shape-determining protein MreC